MDRRNFLGRVALGGGILASSSFYSCLSPSGSKEGNRLVQIDSATGELNADIVIAGAGMGGCAAAMSALKHGLTVVMTEETDWIGGQLTQQIVPVDEHPWINTHGAPASYRRFRNLVRDYYKRNYPVIEEEMANENFNPGKGFVSNFCFEPKVGLQILQDMLAPYISAGKLVLLLEHKAVSADMEGAEVKALRVRNSRTGNVVTLKAPYFVDATEIGDLLPLTGTEYVTGTESKEETGELHAPEKGDPTNEQAFTMCFILDYVPGEDWTIKRPEEYDFWRDYAPQMKQPWTGKLLDLSYSNPRTLEPRTLDFHPEGINQNGRMNWWNYRKIIDRKTYEPGFFKSDLTIVNWPQNDYLLGRIIDVDDATFKHHVDRAKQLSVSLVYWLQTEVPRPDGGKGWPGVRLRCDAVGTDDGLAKYPYIREARRIKSLFTVKEEHVGVEQRSQITGVKDGVKCADFFDSVGVGSYSIDLHPTTGGDNYLDCPSLPFQIPLGALLPVRTKNLLPANKNIGTTHITNGCYREHPTEWGVGEAVGALVAFSLQRNVLPRDVRADKGMLKEFQDMLHAQGVETKWPD